MTSVDTFRENVFCYVPYIQGFSAMSPNASDSSFVKAEIDFDTCRIVFVTLDGAHEDRRAGLRNINWVGCLWRLNEWPSIFQLNAKRLIRCRVPSP